MVQCFPQPRSPRFPRFPRFPPSPRFPHFSTSTSTSTSTAVSNRRAPRHLRRVVFTVTDFTYTRGAEAAIEHKIPRLPEKFSFLTIERLKQLFAIPLRSHSVRPILPPALLARQFATPLSSQKKKEREREREPARPAADGFPRARL